MSNNSEYVNYLLELLAPLGAVQAKRMFGGHGIYRESLMFGLVADETLYLKADDKNRADYETLGLESFVYHKKGQPYSMSYYRPPEDALEDSDELCQWARKAYAAALRADNKKKK